MKQSWWIAQGIMWFTLTVVSATAQEELNYRALLQEDVPSVAIRCLTQDPLGLLWIGSQYGLMRYDGYDFRYCRPDFDDSTTLSNNHVKDVVADPHGYIWLATDNGLNRLDPTTGKFRRWFAGPAGLSHANINSLDLQGDSVLWIGGSFGIDRMRLATLEIDHASRSWSERATASAIEIAGDTVLWYGHGGGRMMRVDLRTNKAEFIDGLPGGRFYVIYQTRRGEVWVGTESGSAVIGDDREITRIDGRINDIEEDASQAIWIVTSRNGAYWIDSSRSTRHAIPLHLESPYRLRSPFLSDILFDREGRVWIGSYGGGIILYDPHQHLFKTLKTSEARPIFPNNRIFATWEDRKGKIWVGCDAAGMAVVDPATGRSAIYLNRPEDPTSIGVGAIIQFTEDRDGNMWMASTQSGVHRTRVDRPGRFDHYPVSFLNSDRSAPWVSTVFTDRDGAVWAGVRNGGFQRYDRQRDRFVMAEPVNAGLSHQSQVQCVDQDSSGYLWIGTTRAQIIRWRPGDSVVRKWQAEWEITGRILAIQAIDSGAVWMGTDAGLYRLSTTDGVVKMVTDGTRIKYDVIGAIERDHRGFLWVAEERGLLKIDPEKITSHGDTRWIAEMEIFEKDEGSVVRDYYQGAGHIGRSGRLYFGSGSGVTHFRPDEIRPSPHTPSIVLTRFQSRSLAMEIVTASSIELPYDHGYVQIEYAGLHYTAPLKTRYRYRLIGHDADWVDAGSRRFVRYVDLSPGRYIFEVKAENGHDVWSDVRSVVMTVQPPFWGTWWFRLTMALAIGSMIYLLISFPYRMKIRIEQLRTKIATDLHDRIGAGLTDISILSNALDHTLGDQADNLTRRTLHKITAITEDIMDGLRDIVWLINPHKDTLYDTVLRLRDHYEMVFASANVRFEIRNIEDFKRFTLSLTQRQDLYLLLKEAIHNAARHSGGSQIWVELDANGSHYALRIRDNGNGAVTEGDGMGMKTMRERAKRLRASLSIRSDSNGTTIELSSRRKP